MKERRDLVVGLLRKAESDLTAVSATIDAEAYDVAAFHAQQATEKLLKAFLASAGIDFPYTHNLAKLVELCSGVDPAFDTLVSVVELLTPYAVELRYDSEFWPTEEEARDALASAEKVKQFVCIRLPK